MAWWHLCAHCGEPDHECYQVTCARCGKVGWSNEFIVEEGDEWECPPCWERCEAQERKGPSGVTTSMKWCTYPGCACTAKYEHGGYFGWYYKCRIHARLLESMDWVFPIGSFSG